jgi:hypothetical protein
MDYDESNEGGDLDFDVAGGFYEASPQSAK